MNDMRKFMKLMEDCDTGVDKNDDGECSPFTHADDNVDMVREDGGHSIGDILPREDIYHLADDLEFGRWDDTAPYAEKLHDYYADSMPYDTATGDYGDPGEWVKEQVLQDYGDELHAVSIEMGKEHAKVMREDEDGDYHEEWVQHLMKMGKQKLWIEYNRTLEDDDYPGRTDELQHMEDALSRLGIDIAEGVMDEDFLIPPKDAKYDNEVEEEDDDWDERDAPELDRQTDFDAPSRYDGDDSYDLDEQGPGDDEFDIDDDAMVDVGDDEDYEVFDFDDEFDKMMGNTYRFDEEDVMEMNELRKRAGLREMKVISLDDVKAAGGEVRGKSDEITGGKGTTTSHRGNNEVVISKMKTFPRFDKWWKEDPEDIMGMIYWQKDQLPPEGEAFDREWEKVKANLTRKYGAAPVEEAEGDTCSRCRKGKMRRGETFMGPAEECDHCNFQRQVNESTDSRDDYVAFTFDNEKAYFLVADECGEMMEFGMQDEMLLPDQWVDQVLVLLKDHGFEKGKDFSVAGMEEDLQNGYNDQHVDQEDEFGGGRFPAGATSSPARELGPAGAKHGDNPMRTPMASVDKKEDDIYESYRHQYRRFRRNK